MPEMVGSSLPGVQGHSLLLKTIVLSCLCLSTVSFSFPIPSLLGIAHFFYSLPVSSSGKAQRLFFLLTFPLPFPSFSPLLLLCSPYLLSPPFSFSSLCAHQCSQRHCEFQSCTLGIVTTNLCGYSNSNKLKINGMEKSNPLVTPATYWTVHSVVTTTAENPTGKHCPRAWFTCLSSRSSCLSQHLFSKC